MEEKLILYGLAGICVLAAALLLFYRSQLLSRLTDKQIEAIFGQGQETEVELDSFKQTFVKIKTRFPALIFLVPASVFAILGHQVEVGMEDWTIKGRFVVAERHEPSNWSDGILTIHPNEITKIEVGEKGDFEINVSIPVGVTFEEHYDFFDYASFDKRYTVTIFPDKEFKEYQKGNSNKGKLTDARSTSRFYDEIAVKIISENDPESEVSN